MRSFRKRRNEEKAHSKKDKSNTFLKSGLCDVEPYQSSKPGIESPWICRQFTPWFCHRKINTQGLKKQLKNQLRGNRNSIQNVDGLRGLWMSYFLARFVAMGYYC